MYPVCTLSACTSTRDGDVHEYGYEDAHAHGYEDEDEDVTTVACPSVAIFDRARR
jgi:hypothetical protein